MKTSITKRLFLYILLVVLGFTTLILLSNSLLLKPLYYQSMKNTMLRAMDSISDIDYTQDIDDWLGELSNLGAGNSYDIVIKNEGLVEFSSSSEVGLMPRLNQFQTGAQKPLQNNRAFDLRRIMEWEEIDMKEDGTRLGIITIQSTDSELMVCSRELSEGVTISLTQAIEPINQSIWQANILLIACAALSLGISAIFVFKISKRFTKPIRQIQSSVGEIAKLNFNVRCDISTGDELESLGGDVNILADELQSALTTLKSQNAQLEKDIITQRQFISNASHELRTPLSLIKGYADEIKIGYAKDEKQKDAYIEIIAEEAAKMNRLLKEMLELSRMENGSIILKNEKHSVNEQISMFIEKYDGFIAENGLKISLKLADGAIGLFDAMHFEQVLANYISNAARYGDEKKRIEISTEIIKDNVRISVFNTGKKIPEDKFDSLWDGFYKEDEARTRVKDSYGLGLSVVKAIQNLTGQKFGVKNVSGGVVFWFDIRLMQSEEK